MTFDWQPAGRADLEMVMLDRIAVVHFDCQGLRLLRDCSVAGEYGYTGFAGPRPVTTSRNAPPPQGGNQQAFELRFVTVGQRTMSVGQVGRAQLQGACGGATHVVRAAHVGAFHMTASQTGQGLAGATTSRNTTAADGDVERCNDASGPQPPPLCRALIQVILAPIAGAP
jgi:uncharacterized protein